jgi:DNA repair exonuclease SbcCD nuclease subunit
MTLSLLPKGFDYYAGGHMHKFSHQEFIEFPHVVYPGTVFAGYHSDLEENAKGQERGIVFVEFEDKVKNVDFFPIQNVEYAFIEINADKKRSTTVNSEIFEKVKQIDPRNKVAIIKIKGELSEGKATDIEFTKIKDGLYQNGSLEVKIDRHQLTSREYAITASSGQNKAEIETNVFKENIGEVRVDEKRLEGEEGVNIGKKLLKEITQPILANEKKSDYEKRMEQNIIEILELKVEDDSKLN